jgi:hypothetical protein
MVQHALTLQQQQQQHSQAHNKAHSKADLRRAYSFRSMQRRRASSSRTSQIRQPAFNNKP